MTRIVADTGATPFRSVLVAVLSVSLAFPPTYVVAQATPAAPAKEQADKQTKEPPKEPSDEFLSALAEVALASLSFGEAVRSANRRSCTRAVREAINLSPLDRNLAVLPSGHAMG